MSTDLRFSVPAAAIATVCAVTVVTRAAIAPTPPQRAPSATIAGRAPTSRRQDVARRTKRSGAKRRRRHFPSDDWSQRDDFGGLEYQHEVARARGESQRPDRRRAPRDRRRYSSPEKATRSRAAHCPDPRAARAVPCKPRPIYTTGRRARHPMGRIAERTTVRIAIFALLTLVVVWPLLAHARLR